MTPRVKKLNFLLICFLRDFSILLFWNIQLVYTSFFPLGFHERNLASYGCGKPIPSFHCWMFQINGILSFWAPSIIVFRTLSSILISLLVFNNRFSKYFKISYLYFLTSIQLVWGQSLRNPSGHYINQKSKF